MPYIKQKERFKWNGLVGIITKNILNEVPEEDIDGELNYFITSLIKEVYKPPRYYNYNRAMGMLECVKQEFYRRDIALYENEKIKENGDLIPFKNDVKRKSR